MHLSLYSKVILSSLKINANRILNDGYQIKYFFPQQYKINSYFISEWKEM